MTADGRILVRGGTVVSMGAPGVFDGDVLVEGGRITALGPDVGSADAADDVIDARGCLVTPGFVQAHVHLCQTIIRGLADDRDVIDWLRERVWPFERAHDAASMAASARLGVAELLLGGTTTVSSMESVHHTDEVYAAADQLGIRGVIGKAIMDRWEPGTEMIGQDTDDAWADVLALHERWHGRSDGRIRVSLAPRGVRNATVEMWQRVAALSDADGLTMHTHVNENEAQAARFGATDEGRDIVALARWGALTPRLVMAHCVWLDETERELLVRHGAHVCHCPSSNLKLASGVAPVPEYLDAGVNVAIGADGAPCSNRLDVFTEMQLAALLPKVRLGPRSMPARRVLALATVNGARALGLADEIGTLEVGKRADVVVIRTDRPHVAPLAGSDPADQIVYACRASDVDTVLVDGRPVVRGGTLTTGDVGAIVADAERERSRLLSRADRPA